MGQERGRGEGEGRGGDERGRGTLEGEDDPYIHVHVYTIFIIFHTYPCHLACHGTYVLDQENFHQMLQETYSLPPESREDHDDRHSNRPTSHDAE